jgi:hypothetical protein
MEPQLGELLLLRIVAVGGVLEVRDGADLWPTKRARLSSETSKRSLGDVDRLVEWVVSDPLVDVCQGAEAGWRGR